MSVVEKPKQKPDGFSIYLSFLVQQFLLTSSSQCTFCLIVTSEGIFQFFIYMHFEQLKLPS